MDQAERQLLQLLRGQDVAEFALRILLRRERPNASAAGGARGRNLVWTITMSATQAMDDRTTSGTSFAQAWQRQKLWWRSAPRTANTSAAHHFEESLGADSAKRAESQFLSIVRGDVGDELTITVSARAGRWTTRLQVPGTAGEGAIGQGASFAYAWSHDWPWWQDESVDLAPRR